MSSLPPLWQVQRGGAKTEVVSPEQAERVLDRLTVEAAARPFIAVVVSPSGKNISLRLGRELTVVEFQANADPPYYASVGDEVAGGLTTFEYDGEETEIEPRHLVSIEAARRAVAEFVKSDERPISLRWEEV
ncbi:MAG: Imm1 family immunity protein [Candidatus Limnocylindria bacterium]